MHTPSNLILVSAAGLRCLILLVVAWMGASHVQAASQSPPAAFSTREFVARVVGDTEDVWSALFIARGHPAYPQPLVVLFSGTVQSACGRVAAAVEPYYCANDRRIYVETAAFGQSSYVDSLADFAKAFLIARAVGHHVRNVLGATRGVDSADPAMNETQRRQLRMRFGLQADCYAGVWAHFAEERGLLNSQDLDQVSAAVSVGDPSTHGAPTERMQSFRKGLASGDPEQCEASTTAVPK